jgi:hypothetical protein
VRRPRSGLSSTRRDNVDHRQGWGSDQLAALSTNTRHATADLDHMAFLEDPKGAAQSVQAVTDVVASARYHTPLRTP